MKRLTGIVPELSPEAWKVLAANTFSAFGSGFVMPFFIVYLHRVRGIDLDTSALVLSWIAVVMLLAGPLAGTLIDRVGSRRALIISLLVSTCSSLAIAAVRQPWHAFAAAVLTGISYALFWPSSQSLLTSVVAKEQRAAVYSVQYMGLNLGLGVGGVIGGLVVRLDEPRTFEVVYGLDAATYLLFALILLAMPSVRTAARRAEPAVGGTYLEVARDRLFVRVWLLQVLLVTIGYSQLQSSFPAYATGEGGIGPRALGFVFGVNTFVIVAAQLVVLRKVGSWKRTRMIVAMCVLWSACWVVTIVSGSFLAGVVAAAGFGLAQVFFALAETLLSPSIPGMVNDLAPDNLRGRYNAMYSTAWSVGSIGGPAAAGLMLDRGLATQFFLGLVAACGLAATAALRLERLLPERVNSIGGKGDLAAGGSIEAEGVSVPVAASVEPDA